MRIGRVGQFGEHQRLYQLRHGIPGRELAVNEVWYQGDASGMTFTELAEMRITALNARDIRAGVGAGVVHHPVVLRILGADSGEIWELDEPQSLLARAVGRDMLSRRLSYGMRCDEPTCDCSGWTVPSGPGGSGAIWQGDYAQMVRVRRSTLTTATT